MIKLESQNVLLKPSHRRQLMSWLRRSLRLGERLGDFMLTITLRRVGHLYEIRAAVHDTQGDFGCRTRQRDWRNAFRDLIRTLNHRLHDQCLSRGLAL